jgi:hypothetical protein
VNLLEAFFLARTWGPVVTVIGVVLVLVGAIAIVRHRRRQRRFVLPGRTSATFTPGVARAAVPASDEDLLAVAQVAGVARAGDR